LQTDADANKKALRGAQTLRAG